VLVAYTVEVVEPQWWGAAVVELSAASEVEETSGAQPRGATPAKAAGRAPRTRSLCIILKEWIPEGDIM